MGRSRRGRGQAADGAESEDRSPKICATCGREFHWRKAWQRSWPTVRYCSQACRRRGVRPVDEQLESAILDLLAGRDAAASICPSEAARRVAADAARTAGERATEEDWRDLMEPARRAARRLVERGEVLITQGGRVVDPSRARGPIRIRRA